MNSPESFYLHLAGAQQGPYTIPQIDHLLNSGLIGQETLYWCEGLDQWQPVTSLVPLRKKPKRWVKWVLALAVALLVAVPVQIFGPVLAVGWKEANQDAFTEPAAYWRARDVVRHELRTAGFLVEFAPIEECRIELRPPTDASVRLRGTKLGSDGAGAAAEWLVKMKFAAPDREWSGAIVSPNPANIPTP